MQTWKVFEDLRKLSLQPLQEWAPSGQAVQVQSRDDSCQRKRNAADAHETRDFCTPKPSSTHILQSLHNDTNWQIVSNCYRKELSTCIVSSTAAAEDSWVWSDMCHVWFFAYAPPQPILRFESRLDIFCCLWHLVTFFVNMSIEIETFLFSFLLYHGLGHRMQTQGLTQDTLFPFFSCRARYLLK